ncbi:MAG: methyltransferase domain-containing protein [Roseiflexaceae bacterium]
MMPLTPELVAFLQTERAQAELAALAQADLAEAATLARLTELRQRFAPAEAAALLDQARLRLRAVRKFAHPERLLLTDEALQQASSLAVAHYRAARFAAYRRVADLGCGVGADTLALAEAVGAVLAVERDPLRAALAEANIRAYDLAERARVLCADWTTLDLPVDAAFADPARRVDERRVFGLDQMEPPIGAILALREQVPDVAVKVAPGVDLESVPPEAAVEFISERGELKEALLLFGGLRGAARTATLLPGPHQLDSDAPASDAPARLPVAVLYEPDPAVLRAGLVRHLARLLDAAQIDPTIAYLTAGQHRATPFARAWQILRHGPFNLKHLNVWLREQGAGEVVVKKRGSPVDPDAFRRRLKTSPGGPVLTVFLTRALDRPWMILATAL